MAERLPVRKNMRLSDFNYSQAGYYFLTICAEGKRCIFGDIVGRGILDAPQIQLTDTGKVVEDALGFLDGSFPDIHIEKYVIMPNHIHLLVVVSGESGASGKPRPTNAGIPKLISSLKRFTNRKAGKALWQTSYYDHIIRNEKDYQHA